MANKAIAEPTPEAQAVYLGPADVRELSAADFKRAGVEGPKVEGMRFLRGVATPVRPEVADVLVVSELFDGEFVIQ